jgi:hypothetical protein
VFLIALGNTFIAPKAPEASFPASVLASLSRSSLESFSPYLNRVLYILLSASTFVSLLSS